MEVIADRDSADPQPLDQLMVNEILRRCTRAVLVERHDHGAIKARSGQEPQLVGLVGQTELRAVRAEKAAWMRLEGQGECRFAMSPAHLQGGLDHGAVAEMDAVEIAHCHDGSPGDRGRRGSVADKGKAGHFGNSLSVS
jgi:hypothetical protein